MKGTEAQASCPACGAEKAREEEVCASCGFDPGLEEPKPFDSGVVLEGRYRIDTEVGRGGMGVVYRGTDLTLGRPVAIKAMRAVEADPQILARFMREARSLAKVEHAALVPVYAVGREGASYYMVMKFVEGRTLQAILEERPKLSPDEVRRMLVEVLGALSALHDAGLVHRDLKPGNLMVGSDGRLTVMDLGIVKAVGERTTATTLGTPRYMPPEMLTEGEVDGRADLYSLGIIAYQALVGEPPFDGPTPMAILYKQAHEPPEPLKKRAPQVPRALAATIERALAKKPTERFANAAEMSAALLADGPINASGRPARSLLPLIIVGGVAVGAIAAVGFLLTRERPSAAPDAAIAKVADAAPKPVDAAPKPVDAGPVDAAPKDAAPVVDAALPTEVTLKVTSDPSGAQVYQGGRLLGRTPLVIKRNAGKGSASLTVKQEGYTPRSLRVDLSRNQSVNARLEPAFELVP